MDSIEVLESQFSFPKQDKFLQDAANKKEEKNEKKTPKRDEKMPVKGKIGKLFTGIKERCKEVFDDPEFQEYMEKVIEFFKSHPILACGLFAILIGIALPIIIFVLFVSANVAFVIAGFIILEVTIFIIGATIMSCSVFFVVTTIAIIGLSILSFYLIFCYLIILLKKRRT